MRTIFSLFILMVSLNSYAGFQGWQITEVFSDETGQVQYIELTALGTNINDVLGQSIQIQDSEARTFTFNHNVANPTQFLIATPTFTLLPGSVQPDFIFSAPLFDHNAANVSMTLNQAEYFVFSNNQLPTDGYLSLDEFGLPQPNNPMNNERITGHLSEPVLFSDSFDLCANAQRYYQDLDGDQFGNIAVSQLMCQVEPGYVLDSSDCNDMDNQINPNAEDTPDLNFIDQNCDGIDRDISDSVFVTQSNNLLGGGTGLSPNYPIHDFEAAQQLATSTNRSSVLIEARTFTAGVSLLSDVNIAGGYLNGFASRFSAIVTTLNVPTTGAELKQSSNPMTYQLIKIKASLSILPTNESSHALTVRDVMDLNLEHVELISGNGGDGQTGDTGPIGDNGGNGGRGGHGVENDGIGCESNPIPARGTAGLSTCNDAGGRGGIPGLGTGHGGTGGFSESGSVGGSGGAGDQNGQPAGTPTSGNVGDVGSPGLNFGLFTDSDYIPANGFTGTSGTDGRGGGGGGPTIGIACLDGSMVSMTDTTIETDAGGNGGSPNGEPGVQVDLYSCS